MYIYTTCSKITRYKPNKAPFRVCCLPFPRCMGYDPGPDNPVTPKGGERGRNSKPGTIPPAEYG